MSPAVRAARGIRNGDFNDDPGRARRQDKDPIRQTNGFVYIMRHNEGRQRPAVDQRHQLVAQTRRERPVE